MWLPARQCICATLFAIRRTILLAAIVCIAPDSSVAEEDAELVSLMQLRFGVPVKVQLVDDGLADPAGAIQAAFAEAKRLDLIFSDYDPDSEARRLADAPANEWLKASTELSELSMHARQITEVSRGAFDVSVGPLTHLWRKTMRFKRVPDPDHLADALKRVGNDKWNVADDQICFSIDGMRLDFGGIAKGYALDRMAQVLKEHGVRSYLIDAGGDIISGEPPPGREGWRIEVERPGANRRPAFGEKPADAHVLTISNRAVATSGVTYQSVMLEGKRYSHIVDPRTGYGVEFLSNVTVEAPTGWLADALASAVSVTGAKAIEDFKKAFPDVVIHITGPSRPANSR